MGKQKIKVSNDELSNILDALLTEYLHKDDQQFSEEDLTAFGGKVEIENNYGREL